MHKPCWQIAVTALWWVSLSACAAISVERAKRALQRDDLEAAETFVSQVLEDDQANRPRIDQQVPGPAHLCRAAMGL